MPTTGKANAFCENRRSLAKNDNHLKFEKKRLSIASALFFYFYSKFNND
jgi:hypothetical protein